MCGVAAVFSRGDVASIADRIASRLAHRGPDDNGTLALVDAHGAPAGQLAHRRLAIIDLSQAGHQPMVRGASGLAISYNGEIYNFCALRSELQELGYTFTGESDTEVLLAGWAHEGPAFLPRIRGMFAFALWDGRAGCAYLVRDRFGMKPLYYTVRPGLVAVASEVGALLQSGVLPCRLSPAAVSSYLATGSVAEPATIAEGVSAVEAGGCLEIRFRGKEPAIGASHRFATVPVRTAGRHAESSKPVAAGLVRAALRDAVEAHLVSDVDVGAFLSGGIDSAAIVALAAEVRTQPLRTFTIGFPEREFSETDAARALVRRFGTAHEELHLSDRDILGSLDAAFAAMDQPSMDGLNVYYVSRAVRAQGMKVALSGLGGDELFAGYPSFLRARRSALLWQPGLASLVRDAAGAVARRSTRLRAEKAALWLGGSTAAAGAYQGSRALFGPAAVAALGAATAVSTLPAPPAGATLSGEVSWYELTGYMRNTLLRDADVFSMAHGLEVRVPFVDAPLATVVAGIDEAVACDGAGPKPLLRLALHDLLPADVWSRRKRGFTLPFEVWLRGALGAGVEAEIAADGPDRCGVSRQAARDVWDAFRRGRTTWSRPWALYTLFRWAREHDAAPAAVRSAA